jgi:hypothetical protein
LTPSFVGIRALETGKCQSDHKTGGFPFGASCVPVSTLKGTLTVKEGKVRVDGHLPLLALPFRGTLQKSIAAELTQALA